MSFNEEFEINGEMTLSNPDVSILYKSKEIYDVTQANRNKNCNISVAPSGQKLALTWPEKSEIAIFSKKGDSWEMYQFSILY